VDEIQAKLEQLEAMINYIFDRRNFEMTNVLCELCEEYRELKAVQYVKNIE